MVLCPIYVKDFGWTLPKSRFYEVFTPITISGFVYHKTNVDTIWVLDVHPYVVKTIVMESFGKR